MYEEILYIIVLVLGFPTGLLLSKMCSDEIKAWKKIITIISALCLVIAVLISFSDFSYRIPAILALFFIIITCLTIAWKSS